MHGYVTRFAEKALRKAISRSPVTAVLGPRQCGKSTLAREFLRKSGESQVYLDFQNRSHRNMLAEPELFFEEHQGDLIHQSSESLAGRIALLDLTPFLFPEVESNTKTNRFWLRGGFPDSLLAAGDEDSFDWRLDFIRTFLEGDIPALGLSIPVRAMERLWLLLSHVHGQIINYSKLAEAADVSVPTLKKYIGILESTYMLRILPPCEAKLKKRLIKSPKVYLRDSGILHALQHIGTFDDLLANPVEVCLNRLRRSILERRMETFRT